VFFHEDGRSFTTEGETDITEETNNVRVSYRYVKFTATQAFDYADQKYVGEIYIGNRVCKISSGKVLDYVTESSDNKEQFNQTYEGYNIKSSGKQSANQMITISKPSNTECLFFKNYLKNGYVYTFFPAGGEIGDDLHPGLSYSEIYLVTTKGNWALNVFGVSGNGIVSIEQTETKLVI
jgi:hypothetical protein